MNANVLDVKPSGQQTSDPLQSMVLCIVGAMQSDFAQAFNLNYKTEEDIRQLKRRLYAKLRGLDVDCIPTGYELCVDAKPNFLPTIPEIIAGVLQAIKNKKRSIRNQDEFNHSLALPNPKTGVMPRSIKDAYGKILMAASRDEAARQEHLKSLAASHDELLKEHEQRGLIKKQASVLLCCRCGRHGVLSHSVRGDSNWYCADHFRPQ